MTVTKMRPAPLAKVAGLGILLSSTDRNPEITPSLSATQAAFFARLGLDAPRARLTAELAGWRL